ncbi:hypothetical protein ADL15_30970 [Actinoplanes awajinensis subsp. mycoplanecinus]|uniref:Uncharacterized protein n=2 Tax=Actinoplanes awajinensis TaxID=135946 RepID=A0A101JKZ1_9ACTN|nr:hypothetical protein ADL15_30970 [Actinoplanes awajinensis subsp. mycoplanecinus]
MDRLVRSNRRLKISMLVTIAVVLLLLVVLIATDTDFPVGLGAPIGLALGALLLIPQRRLLSELNLTAAEGRAILEAERLRRNGVADLPPQARAQRETLRGRIWMAVGLISIVIFVVAARYFFSKAGQTVEEDAPTDVWFGVSFFAGFAALCVAPGALWQAKNHREAARAFESLGVEPAE